jgi:chromosome segregation ATPase
MSAEQHEVKSMRREMNGQRGSTLLVPILLGAVIALIAANIYLFLQLDKVKTDLAVVQQGLADEVTQLKETVNVSSAASRKRVEDLQAQLRTAQEEATQAVGRAKSEAVQRAEALSRQLAAEQRRQEEQQKVIASRVEEVNKSAEETAQKVGTVDEFTAKLAEADNMLDSALKKAMGDMGVMSGLIATNADELKKLKELGDRNYFEFDLRKAKQPTKVGDVLLRVTKTDTKRNRFTLEVIADDKKVEKKDRTLNEPIQFYTMSARQPYELVVNNVQKDRIVGYLATPKVQRTRGAAGGE